MKHQCSIAAAVTILFLGASQARAVGLFAAYWDANDLNNGYGVGLRHEMNVVPIVAVDGRVSWIRFSDAQVETNVYPFELVARVGGTLYFGGGLGMYLFDPNEGDTFSDFSGSLSAGVATGLAGLGVFAELRYIFVEPMTEGIKIDASGFGLAVGVSLSL